MSGVTATDTKLDPSRIANYFNRPKLAPAVILIVVGAFFFAVIGATFFRLVSLLMIGVGVWLLVRRLTGPTDADVDAAMDRALSDLKAQAMEKLNLDPAQVGLIEPLVTKGYDYDASTLFRKGTDGVYRGNVVEGLVVLFSDNEMHTFEKHVDLLGSTVKSGSGEYFYSDVVSINTATDQVKVGKNDIANIETLKITTKGGNSLSTSLFDTGFVADSLNGARQLIKLKKHEN